MHSNSVRIQAHAKRFISLDYDFKKHLFHIIELLDEADKETLEWEQALLDDHEDTTNDIMDHLTQLGHTKPSPTVVAPLIGLETAADLSWLLHRRSYYFESTLRSINSTVKSLTPGPDRDTCLIWQLEDLVGCVDLDHSNLTHDILSLEPEDHKILALDSALGKTLFDLNLQTKTLLSDQAAPSLVNRTEGGIELSKINVPTFDGNISNWNTF